MSEDINQAAARIVKESTASKPLTADIEATWEAWSRGVGKVDARTMLLLRAAFDLGVESGKAYRNGCK